MTGIEPVPQDFRAVDTRSGAPDQTLILFCDHARNALPPEVGDLGLPASAFARHIAYDIGAEQVTRRLAAKLGAPAALALFSRLLIDPNRGADDPTLVMKISDGAIIPGNACADAAEVERRTAHYWRPYRDACAALIDGALALGKIPVLLGVHSFTPCFQGRRRPWEVGVLWDLDPRLAAPLIAALREKGLNVGDNEPYDGALMGDSMYEHSTRRGLPGALVEIRQDLLATEAQAEHWAQIFSEILPKILSRPEMARIENFGSRAGAVDGQA